MDSYSRRRAQASSNLATSVTATFSGAVVQGDLIVVAAVVYSFPYQTVEVSDSLSSTFQYIYGYYDPRGWFVVNVFYTTASSNVGAGEYEITATVVNQSNVPWLSIVGDEFNYTGSGIIYGIDSFSQYYNGFNSGASLISAPALTVYNTDLIYAAISMANWSTSALTPGAGFTFGQDIAPSTSSGILSEYEFSSTNGIAPFASQSGNSFTHIVAVAFNAVNFPLTAIAGPTWGPLVLRQAIHFNLIRLPVPGRRHLRFPARTVRTLFSLLRVGRMSRASRSRVGRQVAASPSCRTAARVPGRSRSLPPDGRSMDRL